MTAHCLGVKRFFLASAILVLVLVAFLSVIYPARCIPWNVMISGPNEGWNAYFQEAAVTGKKLYPSPDTFITNNYPPLSFYAIGFIGKAVGDPILAGRWATFFALLSIAFFIYKIVEELSEGRLAGIIAASFFVATMGLFFERYVGMNDPQLLAQAIMMWAFLLFIKDFRNDKKYFFPIAMMVVAGFFKQNIITFPTVALLWVLVKKGPLTFGKYFIFSACLIGAGFALCYFSYGPHFFYNFLTPRRFFPLQEIAALLDLQSVALAATLSFFILWKHRRESHVSLVLMALMLGLGVHFLQRVGSGVDSNSLFEFVIAIALAVGMAFQLLVVTKKEKFQVLFLMLLLLPLLLSPGMRLVKKGLSSQFKQEARWREECMLGMIKKVQSTPGDVLAEPYVTFRAGKAFFVDGFNLEERIQAGLVSPTVLQDCVKKHQLTKVPFEANAMWPYDDFNFVRLKAQFQDWPNAADRVP